MLSSKFKQVVKTFTRQNQPRTLGEENCTVVLTKSTDAEGLRSQRLRDFNSDVGDNLGTDLQTGALSESFWNAD